MELSREILKRFAQIANGNSNKKQTTPSYMNATAVVSDGVKYVQIDGSDQLTPVSETMGIQNGDRVLVTIENHQATVIGNYSYPADARTANEALSVGGQALTAAGQAIQRIDVLQASSITTENLQAGLASIGYLTATELRALNATVDTLDAKAITTDTLETESAKIGFVKAAQIEGTYATIEQLNAATARIGTLETDTLKSKDLESEVGKFGYLKADEAKLTYATIEQLNAKTVTADEILGVVIKAGYLTADNADLKYATITSLNTATARIGTLETDTLKTKDLESEVGKFGYLKASNLESEVGEFGYLKADDAEVTYATIGALNAEAAKITNLNADFAQFQSAVTQDIVAAKGWMAEGSIGDAQISKVSANKLDAGTIDTSVVTVKSSDGKLQIADNTLQISDANRVRVQVGKDGTGDYTLAVWDVNGQLIWDALGATENTIQRAIIRDSMVSGDAAIQALKIDFQSFETALTEQGIVISGTVVQVGDKSLNVALTEQSQTISDNYTSLVSYTDTAKAAAISAAASDATTKANSALSSAKSYADEAVDGIEIGGRNLVIGSNAYRKDTPMSFTSSEIDGIKSYTDMYMPCEINETYTLQCCTDGIWGDHTLTGTATGWTHIYLFLMTDETPIGKWVKAISLYQDPTKKLTGRQKWKFTVPDDGNAYTKIMFRFDIHSDGSTEYTVRWWDLKVEKGTKATDWTPAPEDTQSQIDNTNATIATHTETLSTHTSQIAANESAIALRVTTQDFNSYKTTVNEELTSAKSRLTTAESSITAMKGEIALKVEQTDIDTAVANIQIGGRNLLRNSNWATGNSNYWSSTGATIKVIADTTFGHALSFVTSSPGSASYRIYNDTNHFTHTSGETYTLSFYIRADSSTTVLTSVAAAQKIKVHEVTTDWVRHTVTYTANMAGSITFWPVEANITIYLTNVKLEKGTKATDWTPAPEDVQGQLDSHASRLTTTESSISVLQGEIVTKVEQVDITNAVNAIQIGGRNLIRHSYIVNRGCSSFSYDKASNTWTCVAPAGSTNWGYGFVISSNKKIIIPRGRTFIVSLEVNPEVECEWINDVNNNSTLTDLNSNDNDNSSLRKISSNLLPANKWTKVWFSYTAKNDVEYNLYDASSNFGIVTTDLTEDVNFQFRNVMGELANKPSEYSPAPEDIDASISDVDAKFANYSTTTQMTAAITAAKDNITQSVSATYATKSDLSTTNSNVSSLTTRVSSAESKLTKDSLVTTIGSYYSTQTYVDEAVEGIEIGGRNLLIGSSDASNLGVWVKKGWSPNIETYNADERTYLLSSNNGWGAIGYPVSEYIGQTLTISGWVKLRDDSTNTEDVILAYTTEDTVTYNQGLDAPSGYRIALSKEEWRYTSATFDSAKNYIQFFFRGRNSDGGTGKSYVLIKDLKIEKGNRATDWTPAPEDVDSLITSVKTIATQTADKFNWIVASGTSATDFTLTDRTATLIAETISLNGDVKVNGDMLVDGSITTDKLYTYSVTTEKLATDAIKSSNYSYSSGNFSSAGTFLDLTTGLIRSKNFAITSDGSAYFSGELHSTVGSIGGWVIGDNCIYSSVANIANETTQVVLQNVIANEIFGNSYVSVNNCTVTVSGNYFYVTPMETASTRITFKTLLKAGTTKVYFYSGYASKYSHNIDYTFQYMNPDGTYQLETYEVAWEADSHIVSPDGYTVCELTVTCEVPDDAIDATVFFGQSMPNATEGETYAFALSVEQDGVIDETTPILSAAGVTIDKFLAVKKTDADGTETMPLYMSANGTIYTEGTVTAGSLYRYDTSADLSYTVLDTGNYTTTLDARYLQLTGGTINGNVYLNNPDTNTPLYITGNAINESSICYKYTGISYNWVVGPGAGYSDFSKFGWYKSDVGALAYLSSDGVFTVTSQVNVGGKVALFADREGGNIQIVSPDGTLWEMDAIGNSYVRLFNYTTYKNLNFYSDGGLLVQGQITAGSSSANAFRAVYGNYGLIMRNDGNAFYFLATNSGDPYGAWNTSYYPLSYNFASNEMRINGSVFTSSYVRLLGNSYAIQFGTGFSSGTTSLTPRSTSGGKADGVVVLGASSSRWSTCFAKNGTSTSSDERDKEIFELDQRYKALFMKTKTIAYRWTDDDSKIIHIGTGAQSFEQSAHECGLSTEEIGAIRHDYWDEPNEDGRTDRYSINYDELLMLAVPFVQSHELTLTEHAAKLINIEAQIEAMKVELDEAHMKIAAQDKVIAELEKLVNAS